MFAITGSHSLLELAARATILLTVALALAWLVRRGSAGVRHLLWTTTFTLLLAVPVLNLFVPSWQVPLLPAVTVGTIPERPHVATPVAVASTGSISQPAPADPPSSAAAPVAIPVAEPPPSSPSIPLPFLLWGVGCAAALTSLAVGKLRFGRLVRLAQPVSNPIWLRQMDMVRERLDIRGDVRLYLSARADKPGA